MYFILVTRIRRMEGSADMVPYPLTSARPFPRLHDRRLAHQNVLRHPECGAGRIVFSKLIPLARNGRLAESFQRRTDRLHRRPFKNFESRSRLLLARKDSPPEIAGQTANGI